jgi:hypothetical protein
MGHMTLDNASNNQTAMEELSRQLLRQGIEFDAVDRRVPCFPHIINICVQHIMDEHSTVDLSGVPGPFVVGNSSFDKAVYITALQGDVLCRARSIVRAARASNKRRDNFRDIIRAGNDAKIFRNSNFEEIMLPILELLCDEPTRWGSSFVMVNRLRILQQVRPHFIILGISLTAAQAVDDFLDADDQRAIAHLKLEPVEWQILQDLEVVLEVGLKLSEIETYLPFYIRHHMPSSKACPVRALLC